VKRRHWTTLEAAVLRRYYPSEGAAVADRLPGRSPMACHMWAVRHGIAFERNAWTIPRIRLQCRVDCNTGCWHWLGYRIQGTPRITMREPGKKRRQSLSGARAVFILVHGRAPRGMAFMGCNTPFCVSPVHVREAATQAEIGQHRRRSGRLVGTATEARRATVAIARAKRLAANAEPRREAA
jgi:hypothetical protein